MTFFAEELRKCLNAAGLSDCGENDCWNYWYERIMASFNEAVDRATRTEQAENAKLREQLAKARDPQRIGGTADPESFVYAIEQLREFRWQHATNDEDAIPYINNVAAAHERENAKLREQVASLTDRSFRMADKTDCLNAENAKLRAVIESEIHCWKGSCNGCVAYRPAEDGWCDQQVWLEELGIEGHL